MNETPDRCPTCGSDDPDLRNVADPQGADRMTCPNDWHDDLDACPSCGHNEDEHITVSTWDGTALGCPKCDCLLESL